MMTHEQAQFVLVPSNVASTFYNKGTDLTLLRVSIWGVFEFGILNPAKNHIMRWKRGATVGLLSLTKCASPGTIVAYLTD
ncbi:MAG: hypothetical protein U9N43_06140 [Euryarchaeota archaeon]|nr:hypothetical protein [Euryarchaeota archaeon]